MESSSRIPPTTSWTGILRKITDPSTTIAGST
jgi:hypothetical protein